MPDLYSFRLSPAAGGLHDPAWMYSRYCGECRAMAISPEAARRLAGATFRMPGTGDGIDARYPAPWRDMRLVEVARLPDKDPRPQRRQRGEVWCFIPAAPWQAARLLRRSG